VAQVVAREGAREIEVKENINADSRIQNQNPGIKIG
jgi:hypothetical protein